MCEVMGQDRRRVRALPGSLISGVKRLRVKNRGQESLVEAGRWDSVGREREAGRQE